MNRDDESKALELHLRAIDLFEAFLDIDGHDRKIAQTVRRKMAAVKRSFAAQFLPNYVSIEFVWRDRCVDVWPCWLVLGQPKKSEREKARIWMGQRGSDWNGSVQRLREEIRKALDQRGDIPPGFFGVHVERSVQIRVREEQQAHLGPEHTYLNPHEPPFVWIKQGTDKRQNVRWVAKFQ